MSAGVSAAQSLMACSRRQTQDTCCCTECFDVTLAGGDGGGGENSLPLDFPPPVRHLLTNPRIFHVFLRHPADVENGLGRVQIIIVLAAAARESSSCEIVNWVERTIISLATAFCP